MVSPTCTDVRVPVTISDGSSVTIAGRLCVPAGAITVQLLLHGFTFGQYYWDLPYQPEKYSYVAAANRAGYATLDIDRLGDGDSSHPLSALITLEDESSVINQIIQALVRGQVGGTEFKKVVLVGHSYGTAIAFYTAGRYQSVEALVVTGASHKLNGTSLLTILAKETVPATSDPKFASSGLDLGYLTTRAGTRSLFYDTQNTDPEVITLDEKLKGTGTTAELITNFPDTLHDYSREINIPVFVVNGSDDPISCSSQGNPNGSDCSSSEALAASERPYYGPYATVEALIVPNSGHAVTLSRSAPQTLAAIQSWISRHVPAS